MLEEIKGTEEEGEAGEGDGAEDGEGEEEWDGWESASEESDE